MKGAIKWNTQWTNLLGSFVNCRAGILFYTAAHNLDVAINQRNFLKCAGGCMERLISSWAFLGHGLSIIPWKWYRLVLTFRRVDVTVLAWLGNRSIQMTVSPFPFQMLCMMLSPWEPRQRISKDLRTVVSGNCWVNLRQKDESKYSFFLVAGKIWLRLH